MELSKRALDFLQHSERDLYQLTEQDIRDAFSANDAPLFEPLITFQLQYGGFIFYAGLEPIKFSLLQGEGGYPKRTNTSIIEFKESDTDSPKYHFVCAMTNYQMQFTLDEQGIYYEDYQPKASSFDKVIEELAIWKEIELKNGYEIVFREYKVKTQNLDKELNLKIISEASDQFTLWFQNELIYMKQCQGLTTLIVSEKYSEKNNLKLL